MDQRLLFHAEDLANRAIGRARARAYYRALCEVVRDVVTGRAQPSALRDFAARAIQRGLPVRADVLIAPDQVIQYEVRFLALALPGLRHLHGDCREWLGTKLRKPADRIEPSIPWNLACAGELIT